MRTLILAAVAALFTLTINAQAQTKGFDPNAACSYEEDANWKNWGAAPYGPTSAAALSNEKIDWWLKCSSLPKHLHAKAKAMMQANPKGQRLAYITPDMVLPEMASAADREHKTQFIMRNVDVARIAVIYGRFTAAKGIVQAAEVPVWDIVDDETGDVYTIGDPFVCGNLSIIAIKRLGCITVGFNAEVDGYFRMHMGSSTGPMPASVCNAFKQDADDGTSTGFYGWEGQCDTCVADRNYYSRYHGPKTVVTNKYLVKVVKKRITVRLDKAAWEKSLGICLEYRDGAQSCGVYIHPSGPRSWDKRTHVPIPDTMWYEDNGNCPDVTK